MVHSKLLKNLIEKQTNSYNVDIVSGLQLSISSRRTNLSKTAFAQNTKQICRKSVIAENKELIETCGDHNHDISTGKSHARIVFKQFK